MTRFPRLGGPALHANDDSPAPLDLDLDLVERLRAGEMDALGLLYQRHGGAVRSVILRADPDASASLADDICQETFLAFHEGLARYEHRARLRSWLYAIALRKLRAAHRKRWWRLGLRRREGRGAAGVALRHDDPHRRVEAAEQIGQLLRALPVAQREVLTLVALEGLPVSEAAHILGISENAASTRLYRARRALEAAR